MGRSLLFLVSGLTIITGIIQVSNQERLTEIPVVTSEYYKAEQAKNLAKSLIDNAVETMKANNNWTGSIDLNEVGNVKALYKRSQNGRKQLSLGEITLDELETMEAELQSTVENVSNETFGEQVNLSGSLTSYTQSSSNIPTNSVGIWNEYKVLLVSVSTYDDIQVTTEVLMQRDSYSKYSYNTGSELSASGQTIWFMDKDNIEGPIHTNGQFAMSGSPTFNGLVTSPNMWRAHSTNPTSPNFYGGSNFNAPVKDAPEAYEVGKLQTAALSDGLTFTRDIKVEFYMSGNVPYANISQKIGASYRAPTSYNLNDINGIISTSAGAEVVGNVGGNITLHAVDDINIIGDITYNTSPLVDSSSTDILGLVSESNVTIDQNAHSYSGTQDLTVHASIMALDDSFYVENYWHTARGELTILGGIVQNYRGPVGTFSGNTIVSGYSKNYQYDTRLKSTIPSYFPRESIFSIVYWKDDITKL